MDRFVATEPYLLTLQALNTYGFSLILGEPASGKSTIMRASAIHAADRWGLAPMWLNSISELGTHWNTNRTDQLFLLDDIFGATNHDPERTDAWNRAIPHLRAAIKGGARFILTSRDYVYAAARPSLKSHELPVVNDGQVVIKVDKIPLPDRRQIVYNHLRLGGQSRAFRAAAKPHLSRLTRSQRFLPETARRLGDPRFTQDLDPSSFSELARFVDEPRAYLLAVIEGLDVRLQVALLLLAASGGSIDSPLPNSELVRSVLDRFGLSRLEVSSALEELDGSLVRLVVEGGERSWQVRHPTVVDSMGDWLLQHTELIDLYCEHASLAELRRQTVCGAELLGATSLPRRLWPQVFARMLAPDAPTETALRFFASRCSWNALQNSEQFDDIVALLDRRRFISPLDADPRARLFLRLSDRRGLTPDTQLRLLDEAIDAAVETFDPYVLTHGGFETAAAVHPDPAYWPSVIDRFLTRIRDDLERHVTDRIAAFDSQVDPLDAVVGIATLLDYVEEWVGDDAVLELIETQRARLQDWAGDEGVAVGVSETMDRFVKALFGIRADADDLFSDVDG